MLLGGLSTGHMVGLAVVAAVFIVFALTASFVAPRRWPDFPGKQGLSVFVIACFVLFGAMLTAVEVFGAESEAKGAETTAAAPGTVDVSEKEYSISVASSTVAPGKVTFVVKNEGQAEHNLVVTDPQGNPAGGTATIPAGGTAKLTVTLKAGKYDLFCSIDGHRKLGMSTSISVG